jgi:hypothetical protein
MSIRKFCAQEMKQFAEANPQVQREKNQEKSTKRMKILPGLAMVTLFALQGCFNLDSDPGRSDSYRTKDHSHSLNPFSIPLESVPSPLPLAGILGCAILYSKFKKRRQ